MRIESLELFLSVAEQGSFSRAAARCFISQQGVSSAVKALERELDVTLFARGRAGLHLTREGEAVAREAEHVVEAYRRLTVLASSQHDEASGGSGTVNVLTTPFVANVLEGLFADYESVNPGMRLRITERGLFDIVDEFVAARAAAPASTPPVSAAAPEGRRDDVAGAVEQAAGARREPLRIIAVMDGMAGDGDGSGAMGEAFEPLVPTELMAACTADSPLAARESTTREELCTYPIAYYSEEFLNLVVRRMFEGYAPDIRQNTSNIGILQRAMEREGAVTFSDSFSAYLGRRHADMVIVPIRDSVFFSVGFLGAPAPDSPEERFARFFRRYVSSVCAPYMQRYASRLRP